MIREPALLRVSHLRTSFHTQNHMVTAVDDVSIEVKPRQIVALVGESGSGKSVTAMSILGLVDPPGIVENGEIWLGANNLLGYSRRQLRKLRGKEMAVIFQDPMNALNPVLTIGRQIMETIMLHKRVSKKEAKVLALRQMQQAGLSDPEQLLNTYPFQISGGMCQRVMICIALVSGARLLIADEPTTALDVTIQAQILKELDRIRKERNVGILLITHDLGVVAEIADYVYVMKSGKIVESSNVFKLFSEPEHPYTKHLLDCR
ncbi:ABC transporter ATP-binding protein [Paenibacillus donghaensis]|uniref:Nickel import ATP-binding protein NikD n=1 Tax=Paenibacillus donghaensis TaxID=414771 RepID=A0A2Z2KEF3_9BACL|nr:ABC transporter ATP-binding protein [Paenibacillus donghaensis]ASA21510.1 nickel import ATP-binding protein NikD [Paenibacillus donghaensis]